MCGILGFYGRKPQHYDAGFLSTLIDAQAHRGPDEQGCLLYNRGELHISHETPAQGTEAQVGLFHRRLSIIDLAGGWQPMSTADGRYHIIFNGEIYNYIELRDELEAAGHRFSTTCDTEVLLVGYAHWGVAVLPRLIGMFAFAIFDIQTEQMLLARDPFGIKPLHYAISGDRLVFSSEIKTMLQFPDISRAVNPSVLYNYLRYGMTNYNEDTMFADVSSLPAASYLLLSPDRPLKVEPVSYWSLTPDVNTDISFDEAAAHVRELFLQSVRLHLRSDVPVGAALSGGIDSSAIVMAMRHLEGDRLDLHTFSYIADDPKLSEEQWIDIVIAASGATGHKIYADAGSLVADMQHLITMQDEPFGSTNIYAQHRVFRLAQQMGIKVMLDGQGADEFLGGYRYYMAARLTSLLHQGKLIKAGAFLKKILRLPGINPRWLISLGLGFMVPPALQPALMPLAGEGLWPAWMNKAWFQERGAVPEIFSYASGRDRMRDYLMRTITRISLPHLLRYEDRNSMAYSIESRVPFLTPELVSFTLSLPEDYIISADGLSKSVFRAAMRGIVPDAILDRTDKVGFATPEQAWVEQGYGWFDRVLTGERARANPAFNHDQLGQIWGTISHDPGSFNPRKVWHWINLIEWSEAFGVQY